MRARVVGIRERDGAWGHLPRIRWTHAEPDTMVPGAKACSPCTFPSAVDRGPEARADGTFPLLEKGLVFCVACDHIGFENGRRPRGSGDACRRSDVARGVS